MVSFRNWVRVYRKSKRLKRRLVENSLKHSERGKYSLPFSQIEMDTVEDDDQKLNESM